MTNFDIAACEAKIELALKTFRTTLASVDQQWMDKARNDFQEQYLAPVEPKVKTMLEAVARLAEVVAAAQRQCEED